MREVMSINDGWKFYYGDFEEKRNPRKLKKSGAWLEGPESMDFDDGEWETVSLPHDFVINTNPYPVPFDNKNEGMDEEKILNAYGAFPDNTGWYRKRFTISEEDKDKKIYIIFDGIYRNSDVYLNNFFIGHHNSGFTGIKYDISDFILYGSENVLSVKCDTYGAEGWFYVGGGIYRNAYIIKTNKAHIEDVYIDYELENKSARVRIKAEIENPENKNIKISTRIIDKDGNCVACICGDACSEGEISDITLWGTENPYLYTAITSLCTDSETLDEITTKVGFREIKFDADKGFFLNGNNINLKGVCCHQNHGGVGTALTKEIYRYRLLKLKTMGVNAYRCSHYPPSPELLNICDELGIMVMNETRLFSSNNEELSNLRYMVKSSRNHPSVIMYSIGNEELHSQVRPQAGRIARTMVNEIKIYDKKRPVTMALLMWNLGDRNQYYSADELSPVTGKLDVAGFNYLEYKWDDFHNEMPQKPMISTEQSTTKCTRGCYDTDNEKCHLSILDKTSDSYMAAAKKWIICDNTKYMSGQFAWTGFDYYGEPTPYSWPAISSQFGIMDLCGYPKDFYYYYKSWWTNEDVIHIATHWNFKKGDKRNVLIFSNADWVELFVNEKSLGKRLMDKNGYLLWENTEYEPGEITAVGYKEKRTFSDTVKTASLPADVELSIDYKENNIAFICVRVKDSTGITVPVADNEIEFEISENGELLGGANGDPSDHTCAKSLKRRVFMGLAQLIIKTDGKASLKAKSEGLSESIIYI